MIYRAAKAKLTFLSKFRKCHTISGAAKSAGIIKPVAYLK